MRIALLFLSFLLFSFLSAQENPISELYDYKINLQEDERSLYRFYTISHSPERRTRLKEFYTERLQDLKRMPFESFSVGGQVDYLLTKRDLESVLNYFEEEQSKHEQIDQYISVGYPIYDIEKQRRRGKNLSGSEIAASLDDISVSFKEVSNSLEKNEVVLERSLAEKAAGVVAGYKEALTSVYEFYAGYDPEFTWWVDRPYKKLISQFDSLEAQFISLTDESTYPKDDGSGIIGNPIGRAEIIRRLKLNMIPYTPEELVEIAMKEFAWCDRELLKASREMGYGDDWKAAQEKVKMSFVPPGQQPEAMLDLYNQSIAFLKENDLLTIPPIAEETWRMKMIPPERQKISPFFLGGEVLQISYPTDEMEHDDKMMSMRGNNPHFSRATVHHELIAGHHLQQFVNRRNHRYRDFRTPFWTEGWALYWELLLWEKGFPRGPEDRIGMLFWRMHRCARIIFSLNYHLGEWTPQQCIDYLVDRVGHERANAEGEVRRSFTGNYGPLYQIAYMVGGLQFRALEEELVKSGKMTYKEFHDAVLEENAMPVEMVRAILTNQKLSKDFESTWRFYD